MSELGFVFKSFAITVALIFVMQIRVGRGTVETHMIGWLEESVAVDGLRYVAEGAVSLGGKGWGFISSLVAGGPTDTKAEAKTEKASRGYSFEIKRSEAYYKQKRREEADARRKKKAEEVEGPVGEEID